MTFAPTRPSRAAISSAEPGAPPIAMASSVSKPASVGSIPRQSNRTTVAPSARALWANAPRSRDFPIPAIPSGDAGHIVLSRNVAEVLQQISGWRGCVHDLGEHEVKHGVMVHLYNLCKDGLGNSKTP